jgi:NAD(P)-dependent dehydrogenase (short-subunit alcohol dehydrogenase family)
MGEELSGKVAIITGGARGIGRATVELFVEQGAKVVIADVDAAGGEELAQTLGQTVRFQRADVSEARDVQALVDLAVAEFGGLNIMFNNAAVSGAIHTRFLDDPLELADFQRIMGVNMRGVMLGSQFAAKHMAKHGGGSIINASSVAALMAGLGTTTYRAAKAGVVHFTKSIAIDLAEYGIRVNCIAPGYIETGLAVVRDKAVAGDLPPEKAERVRQALAPVWMSVQPLKRKGVPRDVAYAALYLASDRSAQVTGMVLPVEGGATAGHLSDLRARLEEARDKALGC